MAEPIADTSTACRAERSPIKLLGAGRGGGGWRWMGGWGFATASACKQEPSGAPPPHMDAAPVPGCWQSRCRALGWPGAGTPACEWQCRSSTGRPGQEAPPAQGRQGACMHSCIHMSLAARGERARVSRALRALCLHSAAAAPLRCMCSVPGPNCHTKVAPVTGLGSSPGEGWWQALA